MIGVVLGGLFLLYRRNLRPLIIAHTFVDSPGITGGTWDGISSRAGRAWRAGT
ncbi:hypothetical protein [Hyphomonas sp.]|uniref:hypothetical protein n=1 Tax=Hyphomonas sp. TaxID=87 RepID=UPI003528FF4A